MEIPPELENSIRQGRAILFLGSGASIGASTAAGEGPPDGKALASMLSTRFLGGEMRGMDLASVADAAESESSLFEVQDYIRELFEDLRPAAFHLLIPTFQWKAIYTVNFDTVIEQAYEARRNERLQQPVVLISDEDPIEPRLDSVPNALALVKLHGCITHSRDSRVPFILTPDQYVRFRKGRHNLFAVLGTQAADYPVVFVGHSLSDPDLRHILSELTERAPHRPAYYFVAPDVPSVLKRTWASRRVFALEGTFEEFLKQLDVSIPSEHRRVAALLPVTQVIERKIKRHEDLSDACRQFLLEHVDLVDPTMRVNPGQPKAFYKGFDLGWYGVAQDLDVRRALSSKLLLDVIARQEADRPSRVELYVVKGFAGAGKSVLLKRTAWDAVAELDATCLYLREYGTIHYEGLVELLRLTGERVFLFVDNAADNVGQLEDLLRRAKRDKLALTIITAERLNEWNVACEDRLSPDLSESFELTNLSQGEIQDLLQRLEQHSSLGFMEKMAPEERLEHMRTVFQRQILVALHEATLGKPFEEILVDEYAQVMPDRARHLYLTVCVLNRLGVGVRAGIISRMYGIPFSMFERDFFKPLEEVVETEQHPVTKEMFYKARHQEIAQIVFERILTSSRERFDEYVRILRALNITYVSDRKAYRSLLNNSAVAELFPDSDDVSALFKIAAEVAPRDAYRLQQQGIYEMKRRNADLSFAERCLQEAHSLEPNNATIVHSLAEHSRYRAEAAVKPLERAKYRAQARNQLDSLMRFDDERPYARHTLIKLATDELREYLRDQETPPERIQRAVQHVEGLIQRGLQEAPSDDLLLKAEADLGNLLSDTDRATEALRRAHSANPHDAVIAVRLAKQHVKSAEPDEALTVLEESAKTNPHDKRLQFELAMVKRRIGSYDPREIVHHLQKACVIGDANYDAQFWLARYLFDSSDEDQFNRGREIFRSLREARIPFGQRHKIRDFVRDGSGAPREFAGTLARKADEYGFVHVDAMGRDVFVHSNDMDDGFWRQLAPGDRLRLKVGFNMSGPVGVNLVR